MTTTKLVTADELLTMRDIGRCELIYGQLVMMSPAGLPHGMVAMRIGRFLTERVDRHDLSVVFAAETGFKIESTPDLVRAPDVSFIRKQRLAGGLPSGFFEGVPDLAVEVVSPDDTRREVAEKVNMWLAHGTTSCWVADPIVRNVAVHRPGMKPVHFAANQELRDDGILPGFVLPLTDVFKQP
jgi:Uma2 family endonuclease